MSNQNQNSKNLVIICLSAIVAVLIIVVGAYKIATASAKPAEIKTVPYEKVEETSSGEVTPYNQYHLGDPEDQLSVYDPQPTDKWNFDFREGQKVRIGWNEPMEPLKLNGDAFSGIIQSPVFDDEANQLGIISMRFMEGFLDFKQGIYFHMTGEDETIIFATNENGVYMSCSPAMGAATEISLEKSGDDGYKTTADMAHYIMGYITGQNHRRLTDLTYAMMYYIPRMYDTEAPEQDWGIDFHGADFVELLEKGMYKHGGKAFRLTHYDGDGALHAERVK